MIMSLTAQRGAAHSAVEDNGEGIPPEHPPRPRSVHRVSVSASRQKANGPGSPSKHIITMPSRRDSK